MDSEENIQFLVAVAKAALRHYNCEFAGCALSNVSWEHAYYGSGEGSFKESRKGGVKWMYLASLTG